MTDIKKAYLAALAYASIIGLSFLFVKITLITATPLDTLAHRFLLASALALPPLLLGRAGSNLSLRLILPILPLGLFYPILFFLFQALGLVHLPSSEAGIIQAVAPIITLIMARLALKEQISGGQLFFVGLSVAGVLLILLLKGIQPQAFDPLGIIFILSSTLAISAYSVLTRKLTVRFTPFTLALVTSVMGGLLFNIAALFSHMADGSLSGYFKPLAQPGYLGAILYLGALSSLGSSYLAGYALSKIEASRMGVFSNLATVIAIAAGACFLKEEIAWYHLLGAGIIVFGVIGANLKGQKTKTISANK